jgi:trimethylamine--corrinoid protein Co-methyltransferase
MTDACGFPARWSRTWSTRRPSPSRSTVATAPSPRPVGRPGALRDRRGSRECVDPVTNEYRPSTAPDLYDAARLAQTSKTSISSSARWSAARSDLVEMDLNTLYACLAGTTKHVGTFLFRPIRRRLLGADPHGRGRRGAWREMPFVSLSNCFVVPPMKFADRKLPRRWRPASARACRSCSCPPDRPERRRQRPSRSAIVQAVAECLAGVVYVNAMAPGASGDLRHMALRVGPANRRDVGRVGGAGAAVGGLRPDAQVLRHPRRRGFRHERQQGPDMQAGWEQGIINALAGSVGAEHDLRIRGHVRLAHGVLARGDGAGQRPDRPDAAAVCAAST